MVNTFLTLTLTSRVTLKSGRKYIQIQDLKLSSNSRERAETIRFSFCNPKYRDRRHCIHAALPSDTSHSQAQSLPETIANESRWFVYRVLWSLGGTLLFPEIPLFCLMK